MWHSHCALLVLLGAAFANGIPGWFYNTGFRNTGPVGLECSSFIKVYDPSTGYFTYRCNPPLVKTISVNAQIADMDSTEDELFTQEILQSTTGSSSHAKATMYRPLTSGRSGSKIYKNKRPTKTTTFRRNRCPDGQIFQSELNICIDYPSAPPVPPRQPSSSMLNSYDIMMSDAPVGTSTFHQNPAALQNPIPASGTILLVGKIDLKNRCQPSEIYLSELDICLPINNCYPYGSTC